MAILGIGIDLVDARRIQNSINQFGDRFIDRIFTPYEKRHCLAKSLPYLGFAKIFAVKEAAIKAISRTQGMTWHDFELSHNKDGKPLLNLYGGALKNANLFSGSEKPITIHVSVSDEPPYATAYVIIEI